MRIQTKGHPHPRGTRDPPTAARGAGRRLKTGRDATGSSARRRSLCNRRKDQTGARQRRGPLGRLGTTLQRKEEGLRLEFSELVGTAKCWQQRRSESERNSTETDGSGLA